MVDVHVPGSKPSPDNYFPWARLQPEKKFHQKNEKEQIIQKSLHLSNNEIWKKKKFEFLPNIQFWQNFTLRRIWIFAPKLGDFLNYSILKKLQMFQFSCKKYIWIFFNSYRFLAGNFLKKNFKKNIDIFNYFNLKKNLKYFNFFFMLI